MAQSKRICGYLRTLYNGAKEAWMYEQGILFEPSAPDTHDQNGRAERLGGVIIAKGRSMRIRAKLPHDLWQETVNTAVYLYNQTP
jgi:hypothetical protein